jgi:hypothetical protein
VLRRLVTLRTSFVPGVLPPDAPPHPAHAASCHAVRLLRLALVPFAAVAAALAGAIYVLLLPICGLASVVGGIAAAAWACIRTAPLRRKAAPTGNH